METWVRISPQASDTDDNQGPDFDNMSSFFPCEIDDAIQYINLGYGAQAPKIVASWCIFSSFCVVFKF